MKIYSSGINLRRHNRTTKPCLVKFRHHDDFPKQNTKWEMVRPRNISAGGLLFLYEKDAKVGDILDFMINLPGAAESVRCQGMVLRIDRSGDCPMGGVAVGFTDIRHEDVAAIDQAVNNEK